MRTLLITLALLLIAVPVFASSATISWTPPTENCDLSGVSIAGYYVKWGSVAGGPYTDEVLINDPSATSYSIPVGAVSDTTLYFVPVTLNTFGVRSDDSSGCGVHSEVAVYFPLVTPLHPTNLQGVVD